MTQTLYLAWRYLAYHKVKTAILITSITLIVFLPVGLRVLVDQSSQQLSARAVATPLVIGAKGSPLELSLNTLYFRSDFPELMRYEQVTRVDTTGLALPIPMYVRFNAQGHPIVGTSLEYFGYRSLEIAVGRQMVTLGECVLGARVASAMGAGPGDFVVSSPESVFDLAGIYPLRMRVVGVLSYSDSPDDDAVFVDIKTTWVIEGLGHGHQDLTGPDAGQLLLSRDSANVVGNPAVVQYNEITDDNIDSFHFHGDNSQFPVSAVIVLSPNQRASALLQGRYQSPDETVQVVRPAEVMDELLGTILTIQSFITAGAVIVGLATLATAVLVFMLSLRLRHREIETLRKIGGSRASVATIMVSEIVVVLTVGVVLAGGLTFFTSQFGSAAIRAFIRM
jgi:putative ABC transport system permease protein